MKRHCIKCGSPAITDTSLYCNKCGSRLPTEKSCLQCGRKFSDDESRFCDKCGSSLALTVSSGIQEPKNSICQACGYENNEANRFHCKNCGAPLRRRVFGSEYRNNRLTGRALRLIPENSGAHRELPEPAPEDLIPLKAHHALQSGNKLKPYQRVCLWVCHHCPDNPDRDAFVHVDAPETRRGKSNPGILRKPDTAHRCCV